jgi:hypothetical protein
MHVRLSHDDEFPDLVRVTMILQRVFCLDKRFLGKALRSIAQPGGSP